MKIDEKAERTHQYVSISALSMQGQVFEEHHSKWPADGRSQLGLIYY